MHESMTAPAMPPISGPRREVEVLSEEEAVVEDLGLLSIYVAELSTQETDEQESQV